MWLLRFVFAMAFLLLLSGCTDLLSVHPLATAETAVFDAALLGEWSCSEEANGNPQGMALIRAGSDQKKDYDIVWIPDEGEALRLNGRLVKVGDRLLFDLIAIKRADMAIPGHFFMLVEKTADGVKFHWLDSEWLRSRVISQGSLAHAMLDDKPVITAVSAEINAFLAKSGLDSKAASGSLSLKPVTK